MASCSKTLGATLVLLSAGGAAAAPDMTEQAIETTRASVRAGAEWVARGVDSWFGDIPFEEGGKVSQGRISLGLLKRGSESPDASVRFRARFRLPNVERQGYLFLGQDNERELVADTPDAVSRQGNLRPETRADQTFFAGLGFALRDVVDFRIGFRGGLKPYVQAAYRHGWPIGKAALLDFRETVFWTVDDQFGSTTALSYERALSPSLSMRWLNAATITQDSEKFELSSLLGAYKSFGHQRLLSLEAVAKALQGSGVGLTDYGLQASWEQPLHKDWLLGEILVGRFWPRPDLQTVRQGVWALGFQLKMGF
jgi:hypothetical protein